MKIVIFGAGLCGKYYIENCPDNQEIIAVCDNNWKDFSEKYVLGYRIISPEQIPSLEFDKVLIAIDEHSPNGVKYITQIREQLLCWLPIENIVLMSKDRGNDLRVDYPRIEFLHDLSLDFYESGIVGAVAECGVCWGDFAVKINEFFPNNKLYLFDTFSSFDDRDLEQEIGDYSWVPRTRKFLATSNSDMVYLKMPFKNNVIIKKGYVPETLVGLEHEKFCFINLDMDLYAPTLAALRFFADKMVTGGIILIHDYFAPLITGVKRAVLEFESEYNIVKIPIGDMRSVAISII